MEASPFYSPLLPKTNFSGQLPRRRTRLSRHYRSFTKLQAVGKCEDSNLFQGDSNKGRMVDENMTTLRKRIREVKALDRADHHRPLPEPHELVDWEKEYCCTLFDSEALEILGQLQLQLMNTCEARPRMAVGFTVMATVSMPVSVLVVMMHLMDAAKGIMDVMQLNG